ncbi:MAG: hypothetical protein E6G00_10515 [Actinobacteria bacterium]|nr:MAG: hypothetical protein E6G00_10515 [Actinomycetota bacterium]
MRRGIPAALLVALCVACLAVGAAPAAARSPFRWRGIVEGAYGGAWTHAERARVLAWMPKHGFNAYVHAPKNDLYQRTNWRDPYPPAEQAEFAREIRFARAHGIDWIPNLSPAVPLIPTPAAPTRPPSQDICFSCPADLQVVLAKLEPFRRAGARTFMISFDDVTKTLTHPEDLVAYGTGDAGFGRANGDFLSRLYVALRRRTPGARLLTVGADYSGTSDTQYLQGLRSKLRPGVQVMWTGDQVPSHAFAPADAHAYGRLIGRRPLVWDNWTDDDTAGNALPPGTARIFLGPYLRRADVAGSVGGFFLNPMNEADLNLLPLATAGDWMRAPRRYRRRSSWLRAVAELAGRRRPLRRTLRAWAETSWSTKLDLSEAPTFVRLNRKFLRRYTAGPLWPGPARRLLGELGLAAGAGGRLGGMPDRAFAIEARSFLDAATRAATAGSLGTRLLAAERPSLSVRRTRGGWLGSARPPDPARASAVRSSYQSERDTEQHDRYFVYGWRTPYAFEVPPYPVPANVMNVFTDRVDALDSSWQDRADAAASSVIVTVRGRRVRLSRRGAFRLGRRACGALVVATDGAGGRTGLRLGRCR